MDSISNQSESIDNLSDNKVIKQTHKHAEHSHNQLDSNCQGCQQEKKQNQKFVQFYQRLDKINNKIQNIKTKNQKSPQFSQINAKQSQRNPKKCFIQLYENLKKLDQKLKIQQLPSSCQIKAFDSKEIGFQLAAALIQRQMKYKIENIKLRQKINELLLEKENQLKTIKKSFDLFTLDDRLQNEAISTKITFQFDKETIEDSLQSLKTQRKPQQKTYKNNKNDASLWQMDTLAQKSLRNNEKNVFQQKNYRDYRYTDQAIPLNMGKNSNEKINKKNLYSTEGSYGLNLWLYQYQTQVNQKNISTSWNDQNKSKKQIPIKPKIENISTHRNNKKYSNINKTNIIQTNFLKNQKKSPQNKIKNY